jgi:hypothetical protein
MEYTVHGQHFSYSSKGERTWGDDVILLEQAIDITRNTSWRNTGFTMEPLFDEGLYRLFQKNTKGLLLKLWDEAGLEVDETFTLQDYHAKTEDQEIHRRAIDKTKLLSVDDFPIPMRILEQRISEICGTPLIAFNPFDQQRIFHFRVVRPGTTDNNPLHRDVWLEDYDNCINLYIPVAGSNEQTSLILIPGSHLWAESRVERTISGADIHNIRFNVPAVTGIRGDFTAIRPSPLENEVLVFSPYLIHGGAVNSSKNQTRISIEIRLWKV